MNKLQICDCTLRDGGYYTNWDFSENLVKSYFNAMNDIKAITHLEIGYRSKLMPEYLGEYFYCPKYILAMARELCPNKVLAIMLNEKDTTPNDLNKILEPCLSYINLIRIAVAPENFQRATILAREIKKKGFKVTFNLMYMSQWINDNEFIQQLSQVEGVVDYIYMVDSYGGVYPEDIKKALSIIKKRVSIPIGFHGHNNLEMGLVNTLTAIKNGCNIVDATIRGMGRGAGNLKTELLLTCLNSKIDGKVDFNKLSPIVTEFEKMQKEYGWGTSLSYMISGAYSLPQKVVMSWISKRRYTTESIINALQNKTNKQIDNLKVPVLGKETESQQIIIIGGGANTKRHAHALIKYCKKNLKITLIHAGTRYVEEFNTLRNRQYYCLLGAEGYKIEKSLSKLNLENIKCILEPSPRKMGTILPDKIINKTFELPKINFMENYPNSLLSLAFQLCIDLKASEVMLFGFDGYDLKTNKQMIEVSSENQLLISSFMKILPNTISLTESNYTEIKVKSIYSLI